MEEKGMDFKHKEVVNIIDGKKMGYVQDVYADLKTGKITHIVVPSGKKNMKIFSQDEGIKISWEKIKCIGEDLILVEI